MQPEQKKTRVPLEEALTIAGSGTYTSYVALTAGMTSFSCLVSLQGMAIVMPAAGCQLQLSSATKGIITSMTFTGMLFSAQLLGFMADSFGRKNIMMLCQLASLFVTLLLSLAPETISLAVILFVNGLIMTGSLTTSYVFLGEFCPSHIRAKALIVMASMGALANIYLPGMAWIILPLDIYVPLLDGLAFTSWRLYILLIMIPVSISLLLLSRLPETPKFLLSQGKQQETLDVLSAIFSVNQKKNKDEFPVAELCLDLEDEISSNSKASSNQFIQYSKMMIKNIGVLFSKQYICFTLISCVLLFGQTGSCNTLVLWFPEKTSRIRHYSQSHEVFNVTLCELMTPANAGHSENCQLDYDFLFVGILLGVAEVITCALVGLCAHRMDKRLFLSVCTFLTAGLCFLTIFLTSEYIIIVSLAVMIVILYVTFPVVISIVVELFPTHLRSTATSITMTCARMGSAFGNQIMGVLYENHCRTGYFGITIILIVTAILSILIPTRKRTT